MREFFSQVYFDNTVRDYLISLGIILLVLLFNRIISKYAAGLIFSLVGGVWKKLDKKIFIDKVIHPLGAFLVVFFSLVAFHRLHFPGLWDVDIYKFTLRDVFKAVGTIILLLSFTWLLLRTIDFIATVLEQKANLTEDQADNQLIVFFKDFFKVIIIIVSILLLLRFAFGFNISNLLTGLSIVGAAIALSLRESLENLIASFIIFFDKPFTTGDLVKVQSVTGTVEKIGLRSTRIRTDQKTFVTVPNKQMVDSILDNLSLRTQRRGDIRLELDLGTSSEKLQSLIDGIKKIVSNKDIENSTVIMDSITPTAYLVTGEYYTPPFTITEFNQVKETVNLSVLKLMESLSIQIAGANKEIRVISAVKEQLKQ